MSTPDPVSSAADLAAHYMRDGMDPRVALRIAANTYRVHISAVAAAAGERGGRKRGKQSREQQRKAEEQAAFEFIK